MRLRKLVRQHVGTVRIVALVRALWSMAFPLRPALSDAPYGRVAQTKVCALSPIGVLLFLDVLSVFLTTVAARELASKIFGGDAVFAPWLNIPIARRHGPDMGIFTTTRC